MSLERINHLRRLIHVHSLLYYHMHTNFVPDATYDKWSNELVSLQKKNPTLVNKRASYLPNVFKDWSGDTGMHLPLTDSAWGTAQWLLRYRERHKELGVDILSPEFMNGSRMPPSLWPVDEEPT